MRIWSIAKPDKQNVKFLSAKYNIPPIIAGILDERGITSDEEIKRYLFDESTVDDPFEIKDMDKAVNRILSAVDNGERICVYGDFDADGVTSTSLLYSYLETIGADVMYYIPSREKEGYGMNLKAMDTLNDNGVKLIVTVDNGITSVKEVAYAKSLGIDTVITDHHTPEEVLPDAEAVVDLHRADCKSRFKMISGVGVAFKLVMALEGDCSDLDFLFDNYSDLLSIGTVADVMPLIDENRVFVKRGLKSIENCDRPGIAALIENSGIANSPVTANSIGFKIAPRLNAAGRLGGAEKCVELLLTDDPDTARRIADELCGENSQRQRIEGEILSKINQYISMNPSVVQDRIIIISGKDWHKGVVGLVSQKVRDAYGKPCIVLSEENGICSGSGRSIEGFDLLEAVRFCDDILVRSGGHKMALGVAVEKDNLDKFRKKINEFAVSKGEMPYDCLNIDCNIIHSFLNVDLAKSLYYLQPYGTGNPYPVFSVSKLKIMNIYPFSNDKHLKIKFSGDNNIIFYARLFNCSPLDFPYSRDDVVDIAVKLEVDYYNNESLSAIIEDIKYSKSDNKANIDSLRVYEGFCRGENISKDKLLTILPDRNDCALVYNYLKKRNNTTKISLEVIASTLSPSITYGKLKVILEVFNELSVIALYEDMYVTQVKLLKAEKGRSYEDTSIIKALKEVCLSE